MRSTVSLSISPILEDKEPLLIIAPPFNDLILTSLYILNERAIRGRITHAKWLTQVLLQDLKDVVERYPSVLFIDPPTKFNMEGLSEVLGNRNVYVMRTSEIDWLRPDVDLEFGDSIPRSIWQLISNEKLDTKSARFVIAAVVHEMSVSQYINKIDNVSLDDVETLEYPAIPGLLLMPIHKALAHSISPIIPNITGNEENARKVIRGIVKNEKAMFNELSGNEVLEIIRAIANELLMHGIKGNYLDKLMIGLIKWKNTNVDLLETLLSIESQLSFWHYIVGAVRPITEPDIIVKDNNEILNLINNYLSLLGHTIANLLMEKTSASLNVEQPLPIMDRICSMSAFTNKQFVLEFPNLHWIVKCPRPGGDEDIVFNRYGYSIAVKVVSKDEYKG